MSPVKRRGRPPLKNASGENSRQRIIDAAMLCFQERGVAMTRASDIALKAGVDQPLINYYFPRIEALHVEVIDQVARRIVRYMGERTGKESGGMAVLREYVLSYFEFQSREPELFSLWLYFYYLVGRDLESRKKNEEFRRVGRERVSLMLYRLLEEGRLVPPARGGLTIPELAEQIIGIISGNVLLAATESRVDSRRLAERTWIAIQKFASIAPHSPAKRA